MAVGTSLSRLTGFLRIAAMAFAIGITETRLADSYNIANTTPNIIYELALGCRAIVATGHPGRSAGRQAVDDPHGAAGVHGQFGREICRTTGQ